jgi:hypothetical protein
LLAGNRPSEAVAIRAGLRLRWSGPDHGNPDADAVRLVYADRPFDDALLEQITKH